jgi:WD40 repeat protein
MSNTKKNHSDASITFTTLTAFFDDGFRFLQMFFLSIEACPLHCYTNVVFVPHCHLYEYLLLQARSIKLIELISAQKGMWSQRARVFEGHNARCATAAFSADDMCIVSGSVDETVRIWDLIGTSRPRQPVSYCKAIRAPLIASASAKLGDCWPVDLTIVGTGRRRKLPIPHGAGASLLSLPGRRRKLPILLRA